MILLLSFAMEAARPAAPHPGVALSAPVQRPALDPRYPPRPPLARDEGIDGFGPLHRYQGNRQRGCGAAYINPASPLGAAQPPDWRLSIQTQIVLVPRMEPAPFTFESSTQIGRTGVCRPSIVVKGPDNYVVPANCDSNTELIVRRVVDS